MSQKQSKFEDDSQLGDATDESEAEEINVEWQPDLDFIESNGFEIKQNLDRRSNTVPFNSHLLEIQKEIHYAVKYGDQAKLQDLGAKEQLDLNFLIEIEIGLMYSPLQLASVLGDVEIARLLLQNQRIDVNCQDQVTGVNSFWLACFYGRGSVMRILAKSGIDIYQKHKQNLSNVLHVAVERYHLDIFSMLIDSGYPLDEKKLGGLTALMISAGNKKLHGLCFKLIQAGANLNEVSDKGETALQQAILTGNQELAYKIVKKGGNIFINDMKFRNKSPFFQAISIQSIWAIEIFCDHGADMTILSEEGMTPQIYAAVLGYDYICMYLCLRSSNIDQEKMQDGHNVFTIYMLRQDTHRMNQILMRGADVNYVNFKGKTPLHIAIENQMPKKLIKLLIKSGADPHYEDFDRNDVCDKVKNMKEYQGIKIFERYDCKANPQLRINA